MLLELPERRSLPLLRITPPVRFRCGEKLRRCRRRTSENMAVPRRFVPWREPVAARKPANCRVIKSERREFSVFQGESIAGSRLSNMALSSMASLGTQANPSRLWARPPHTQPVPSSHIRNLPEFTAANESRLQVCGGSVLGILDPACERSPAGSGDQFSRNSRDRSRTA